MSANIIIAEETSIHVPERQLFWRQIVAILDVDFSCCPRCSWMCINNIYQHNFTLGMGPAL